MDTAATPNLGQGEADSPAAMEIAEQVSTYRAFNGLVKWGSLGLATLLLFLVLAFCTKAGPFAAALASLIMLGLGSVAFRAKIAVDPARSPA